MLKRGYHESSSADRDLSKHLADTRAALANRIEDHKQLRRHLSETSDDVRDVGSSISTSPNHEVTKLHKRR